MDFFKKTLLVCVSVSSISFVSASSAGSGSNAAPVRKESISVPSAQQSADMRDAQFTRAEIDAQNRQLDRMLTLINTRTQMYIAEAVEKARAKGITPATVNTQLAQFNDDLSRDRLSPRALNGLKRELVGRANALILGVRNADVTRESAFVSDVIEFMDRNATNVDVQVAGLSMLYAFADMPYSIGARLNAAEQSAVREAASAPSPSGYAVAGGGRSDSLRDPYGQRPGFAAVPQGVAEDAQRCPDTAVLGHVVKDLFPHFSNAAFEYGLLRDMVSGDQKSLGTIKIKGQWWRVTALKKDTTNVPMMARRGTAAMGTPYSTSMYVPANGMQPETYMTPYVAGYAARFNTNVEGVLIGDIWTYTAPRGPGMTPPPPTRVEKAGYVKRLHKCLNGIDAGGVFYKRDTTFDDGYPTDMCTYVARSFSHRDYDNYRNSTSPTTTMYAANSTSTSKWLPSVQAYDYTYVFERVDQPTEPVARNPFIKRVYAQQRSYYMRNQNLMRYERSQQPNVGQSEEQVDRDRMVGELKERIARDRVYQMQSPEYRVYGRIYGATPGRIDRATQGRQSDAMSDAQLDAVLGDDVNSRVYAYDYRRVYGRANASGAELREGHFDGVGAVEATNAATINQDDHQAAQYALRERLRERDVR